MKQKKKIILSALGQFVVKLFGFFLLLGIAYVALYPILTMFLNTFSKASDIFSAKHTWIPDNPTFDNYIELFKWFKYWDHAWITIQIVVISTLLQLVICSMTGYGLARYKFKGNVIVFMMMLITIVVPMKTAQIPMYLDYRFFNFFGIGDLVGKITGTPLETNLLNTHWVYYLPAALGVGLNAGLFTFMFRQFFKSMPKDLEDAGRVDGCNALQVFLRIIVPNTIPVFVTVALLSCVFYWNDTDVAGMFLNLPERSPLMLYAKQASNDFGLFWQTLKLSAEQYRTNCYVIMLTSVAPLVLVYIVGQKFFTECMDRSGIKG